MGKSHFIFGFFLLLIINFGSIIQILQQDLTSECFWKYEHYIGNLLIYLLLTCQKRHFMQHNTTTHLFYIQYNNIKKWKNERCFLSSIYIAAIKDHIYFDQWLICKKYVFISSVWNHLHHCIEQGWQSEIYIQNIFTF